MTGLTFADALDAALGSERRQAPIPPRGAPFTSRHANPFLFVNWTHEHAAKQYAGMGQPHREMTCEPEQPRVAAAQPPRVAAAQPVTERVHRSLTDTQSRALQTLRSLGAALASDFTAADLRREYRKLARRLHPDSHPGCSRAESESFARQFALATDSYQRLLASIEPRH